MPINVKKVTTAAFLAEADRLGLELSKAEQVAAQSVFDFDAVQAGIDDERDRLRLLMEDRPAMRRWLRLSELDFEDQRRLMFLARLYARLLRDMRRSGRPIDEGAAQRAKDFLKTTG